MEYKDRITKRNITDSNYIYVAKIDSLKAIQTLGMYEDFGLTPQELATVLTEYEMQKSANQWDMDKIEKWQSIKNRK